MGAESGGAAERGGVNRVATLPLPFLPHSRRDALDGRGESVWWRGGLERADVYQGRERQVAPLFVRTTTLTAMRSMERERGK